MIKIQACVQTSHINFGKRILAERTHCVLNVLLPLNTITHCYKNPHNVRTKISLWLIFTTSITDFSRQEAVNATLHHVSLFFPVKHLIMYLHALCANFFSHCPFIWENFMINIWIRNSRIPSQKYMFSVLFWFELLWFGDNDWRYVFFCYNGTRQHSARGAPQKKPKTNMWFQINNNFSLQKSWPVHKSCFDQLEELFSVSAQKVHVHSFNVIDGLLIEL